MHLCAVAAEDHDLHFNGDGTGWYRPATSHDFACARYTYKSFFLCPHAVPCPESDSDSRADPDTRTAANAKSPTNTNTDPDTNSASTTSATRTLSAQDS